MVTTYNLSAVFYIAKVNTTNGVAHYYSGHCLSGMGLNPTLMISDDDKNLYVTAKFENKVPVLCRYEIATRYSH